MIRFFVSSTFRDMHTERDLIHNQVFPALSQEAFAHADTVDYCDLRWGVDTTGQNGDEANRKVLSVCLREIDRCCPYMLVLLGDRYGFCPGSRIIRETLVRQLMTHVNDEGQAEQKADELLKDGADISITELEILYGAFLAAEGGKVLFCFRKMEGDAIPQTFQPEDDEAKEKLACLKKRIEALQKKHPQNYKIKEYEARYVGNESEDCRDNELKISEGFAGDVAKNLADLMKDEWDRISNLKDWEQELARHEDFAKSRREHFAARGQMIAYIRSALENKRNLILLKGASGSGKTALMSRLAEEFKTADRDRFILFCGYSPLTCRARDVARLLTAYVESALSESGEKATLMKADEDFDNIRLHMDELFSEYESRPDTKRLLILIDAADQLDNDEIKRTLSFLPTNISEKIQVIISSTPDFTPLTPGISEDIDLNLLENDGEKEEIFNSLLSFSGKELPKSVRREIFKKANSDSPLYLSLLAQRLNMLDAANFEKIDADASLTGIDYNQARDQEMLHVIADCPEDTDEMCVYLIDEGLSMVNNESVSKSVPYIVASRYGLGERDLAGILFPDLECRREWNSLEFTRFCWYLKDLFLIREDGRYDFFHKNIREGYGAPSGTIHRDILNYLLSLGEYEPLRVNELVYHCRRADAGDELVDYLCGYSEKNMAASEDNKNGIYTVAARELLRCCLEDEDESGETGTAGSAGKDVAEDIWFIDILKKMNPWIEMEKTVELLEFIYGPMRYVFGFSDSELDIQKRLYRQGLVQAERLDGIHGVEHDGMHGLLYTACDRMGEVCSRIGGFLNINTSLRMLEKKQKLKREENQNATYDLAGEESNEYVTEQRDSFRQQGDIFAAVGGRENINRALRFYEKACVKAENVRESSDKDFRKYIDICGKMADMQMYGDWDAQKAARRRYETILNIVDGRLGRMDTSQPMTWEREWLEKFYIQTRVRLGDALVKMYGSGCDESLKQYEAALAIAEKFEGRHRSEAAVVNHLLCRERVLFLKEMCRAESGMENKGISCENMVAEYDKLCAKLRNPERGFGWKKADLSHLLAVFRIRESSVLLRFAGNEDEIEKCLDEADGLLDGENVEGNASDTRMERMLIACFRGDIRTARGDDKAEDFYREACDRAAELGGELGTADSLEDELYIRMKIPEYRPGGCKKIFEDALSLYHDRKSLKDLVILQASRALLAGHSENEDMQTACRAWEMLVDKELTVRFVAGERFSGGIQPMCMPEGIHME